MRSLITLSAACVLLAACDQNPKSNDVTIKGQNGNVTISANGQNFTMKANDDKSGSFSMSADNGHFTMHASDGKQNVDINATGSTHAHIPDFVADYPGAKARSVAIGSTANGISGTFTFETPDSPATVIAFYKQRSAGAGLVQAMNLNMGPTTMFTAHGDGGKKSLQVVASSSSNGAHVQVNWTGK